MARSIAQRSRPRGRRSTRCFRPLAARSPPRGAGRAALRTRGTSLPFRRWAAVPKQHARAIEHESASTQRREPRLLLGQRYERGVITAVPDRERSLVGVLALAVELVA